MAGQYWTVLSVIVDERGGICGHCCAPSRAGHDVDAHAADLLELVCYVNLDPACFRYPAGRGHSADAGPPRGNKLLSSRRFADQRQSDRPLRRITAALAASLL